MLTNYKCHAAKMAANTNRHNLASRDISLTFFELWSFFSVGAITSIFSQNLNQVIRSANFFVLKAIKNYTKNTRSVDEQT